MSYFLAELADKYGILEELDFIPTKNHDVILKFADYYHNKGKEVPKYLINRLAFEPIFAFQYATNITNNFTDNLKAVPPIIMKGILNSPPHLYDMMSMMTNSFTENLHFITDEMLDILSKSMYHSYRYAHKIVRVYGALEGLKKIPQKIMNEISTSSEYSSNLIYAITNDYTDNFDLIPESLIASIAANEVYSSNFLIRLTKNFTTNLDKMPENVVKRTITDPYMAYHISKTITSDFIKEFDKVPYYVKEVVKKYYPHVKMESNVFIQLYSEILTEGEFKLNPQNSESIYNTFRNEYNKSTGVSWNYEKFVGRANAWTFYGDEKGFIAVRHQKSGLVKLVGAAGGNIGKFKGIKELLSKNLPVWGMVSDEIASMASKMGFIRPPAFLIKTLVKFIPSSVFGGVDFVINNDGSLTLKYADVGEAKKYFICTKQYFTRTAPLLIGKVPNAIIKYIERLMK